MRLYLILFLLPFYGFCQIDKDSISIKKDSTVTLKSSCYARTMLVALTTGSDTKGETLSQRITRNVEFGRSFDCLDVGLAFGEFRHMIPDSSSTTYIESRFTLDAFQMGRFSNELSVGTGYLFNSKTPIMLEISSTLFAQIGNKWGAGFVFGNIDFIGDSDDMNKSFFGIYLRCGLERTEGGFLTNHVRMLHNTRKHRNKKIRGLF